MGLGSDPKLCCVICFMLAVIRVGGKKLPTCHVVSGLISLCCNFHLLLRVGTSIWIDNIRIQAKKSPVQFDSSPGPGH